METWTGIVNVVLAGVAVTCAIWGIRQKALLDRVANGLTSLREGRFDVRVQRGAEDNEPILKKFDALAQELGARRLPPPPNRSSPSQLIGRLCDLLRPSLMALRTRADAVAEEGLRDPSGNHEDAFRSLRAQIDGLVRLLEAPATLSELRRGVLNLQSSEGVEPIQPTSETILIIDEEGPTTAVLASLCAEAGWSAFVASGFDAARIMTSNIWPAAILVNAGWPGGRGWKVWAELAHLPETRGLPIWFFDHPSEPATQGASPAAEAGSLTRLWRTRETWLWPLDSADIDAAVERFAPFAANGVVLAGAEELSRHLATTLAERGIMTGSDAQDPPVPSLPECCTVAFPSADGADATYLLVVPKSAVRERGDELARAFRSSQEQGRLDADTARDRLIEELRRIGHRSEPAGNESTV